MILPLITGYENGAFFIFGSPEIYIQGLDEEVPEFSARTKSAAIEPFKFNRDGITAFLSQANDETSTISKHRSKTIINLKTLYGEGIYKNSQSKEFDFL